MTGNNKQGKGSKVLRLERNVNPSTGEIYSEKSSYYEPSFNDEGYKVPYHKKGARMFEGVSFPKGMTDAEIGKVTRLARLMIPLSNMLGYRRSGQIHPYTERHIYNVVGLSRKRGKIFLSKMIELGVMQSVARHDKQVEYYINPAYFFAGRRIDFNLYLLFREHLDLILPAWVRREFNKMVSTFRTEAGDEAPK